MIICDIRALRMSICDGKSFRYVVAEAGAEVGSLTAYQASIHTMDVRV